MNLKLLLSIALLSVATAAHANEASHSPAMVHQNTTVRPAPVTAWRAEGLQADGAGRNLGNLASTFAGNGGPF